MNAPSPLARPLAAEDAPTKGVHDLAEQEVWYRAVLSRDARFDGRFFTGVRTTGIYCRPICPARTPLRQNVAFFTCAAAAEDAGFRPCLRCRPEAAPGTPSSRGSSATVARALRLIDAGGLGEGGVAALASRLGIGARQLRRLFLAHLGASPLSVAASRRNHSARLLIDATALPMTKIAATVGFRSLRQFNGAMRAVFGNTPTVLRRGQPGRGPTVPHASTLVRLAFRPPFDWEALLRFLQARAVPGVEAVSGGRYRRTVATGDTTAMGATGATGRAAGAAGNEVVGFGTYEVGLARDGRALELSVAGIEPAGLLEVVRRVRRQFDLDADPQAIIAALGTAELLVSSIDARPGLRVPGAWDRFEALVRAVVGQQISVAAATTLCGRLAARCGTAVADTRGLTRLFPTAGQLATADLSGIGIPRFRAATLRHLAVSVQADATLLEPAPSLDALIARLTALPGVGAWTAHYMAMRAFNEPDGFPSGDLVLRRAAGNVSSAALERLSRSWRPWRAYAALHLWTQTSQGAVT